MVPTQSTAHLLLIMSVGAALGPLVESTLAWTGFTEMVVVNALIMLAVARESLVLCWWWSRILRALTIDVCDSTAASSHSEQLPT